MSSRGGGSGSGNSRGEFPINIVAKDVGLDQAITKVTRFADVIKTLDQQFRASLSSMTAYNNMFTNFGRNFTTLNQGFNQGAQGAQRFNQAMQQNVNTLRAGQTTLTQFMNTQRQTAQTAQQASASQATLTQNTMRLNQAFSQTAATLGNAQGQLMRYNQTAQTISSTMRNATANTFMFKDSTDQSNQSLRESASAADTASGGFNRVGEAIGGAFRSGMNLFLSFTMLRMAMQESVGMQEMLATQQAKVNELTEAANEAIAEYGENSKEANKAIKARDEALRGLSYTQRNANMAAGDASFFIIMMATNILSMLIPALTNLQKTQENVRKGWEIFSGIITSLPSKFSGLTAAMGLTTAATTAQTGALTTAGAAATRTTVQMGALSTVQMTTTGTTGALTAALGFLTSAANIAANAFRALWVAITGPVGLLVIGVITAITTAVALLRDNTFGVRDALNELGVRLGEMVPALKGPLELIKGIAGAIGVSGEETEEWSAALSRAFTEINATMDPFFDSLEMGLNVLDAFFQQAIKAGAELVEGFRRWAAAGIAFLADVNTWKNAWSGLVNSATAAGEGAIRAIQDVFNKAGAWIFGQEKWASFLAGAQVAANEAVSIIQKTFADIASWFDENVTKPMAQAIVNAQPKPAEVGPSADVKKHVSPTEAMAEDVDKWFRENPQVLNSRGQSSATALQRETGFHGSERAMEQIAEAQKIAEGVPIVRPAPQTGPDMSMLNPPGQATTFFGADIEQMRQDVITAATNEQGLGTKLTEGVKNIITPSSTGNTTQAVEQQKTALEELVEKQDEATDSGAAFLAAQTNLSPSILNNKSLLESMARSLDPVVEGNDSLEQSLKDNANALENNVLQGELYRKGQLEQRKVLQDMQMQIETNNGTLDEYASQIENGTILVNAFTLGQQEQRKALLDSQVEIASTAGRLDEYGKQLESGEAQQVAFIQGQQEIQEQFLDTQVATANLNGQYSELVKRMNDAEVAQVMFNNGLAEGRAETAQAIISMDSLTGSYLGSRKAMLDYIGGQGRFIDTTNMSNEAVLNWIAVSKGVPDAVNAMIDSFTEFGDSVVNDFAAALKEGEDAIDDAIENIEETIGDSLTGGEVMMIKVQAETTNAVNEIKSSFGLAFKWVMDQELIIGRDISTEEFQANVTERMGEAMEKVQEQIDNSGDMIRTSWGNIMKTLSNLTTPENIMNKDAWIQGANDIAASLHTIQMGADEALEFMRNLGFTTEQAIPALTEAGFSAEELAEAAANAGTNADTANGQFQAFYDTVQRAGELETVFQVIFEQNLPVHVENGVNAATQKFEEFKDGIGPVMGEIDSLTQTIFETNVPNHASIMADNVNTHFETMKSNAQSTLSDMEANAEESFQAQGDAAIAVAQGVSRHFSDAKAAGERIMRDLENAVVDSANAMADAMERVADAVDSIGESARNAQDDVESLRDSVESLPNVERTITYRIETVGRRPEGAQFGTNMLVDKPQMLLVGEGWGKERVKVAPGTMPFAEDFRAEMNQKFEMQRAAQTPASQTQTQTNNNPNVYAPGYQHTNQTNNPDIGGGSRSMMINSNASLVQMNNGKGKRMIVDGKTGTVIMLDGSSSSSGSNSGSGGGSGSGSGNGNSGDMVGQNNNVNIDNDSNSKNNVYAPGYFDNNNKVINNSNNGSPGTNANGSNGGVTQSQSVSQSGSGQNYYYQSQTNNGVTTVNSNIPIPPGMINQSAASSGNIPTSGSFSSDSRSRLLARGDPFGFQTRVVHETPIEVNIDLEGVKLAKKIIKILTEEMGWGSGYYG